MTPKDTRKTTSEARTGKAASKPDERAGRLRIRLKRSLIGRPWKQREVVKGLGLRKLNSEVIRKDCPEIRGMVNKIPHLLEVEVLVEK